MSRNGRAHLGPILFMVALGGAVIAVPLAGPIAATTERRLESFPVDAGRTFLLVLKSCGRSACPLVVRLTGGSPSAQELPLEWGVGRGPAARTKPDINSGVLGALSADTIPQGWTVGEEENAVSTYARLVRLAPGRAGLLVTQSGGFDHPKRRHELFVAVGPRLRSEFAIQDLQGPSWSAMDAVDLGGDRSVLVHVSTFEPGADDQPDTLEVSRHVWDAKSDKLRVMDAAEGPAVQALTVGKFATIAAARQEKAAKPNCLGAFVVVPASSLAATGNPKDIVLAAASDRHAEIEAARARVGKCAPGLPIAIVSMSQRKT